MGNEQQPDDPKIVLPQKSNSSNSSSFRQEQIWRCYSRPSYNSTRNFNNPMLILLRCKIFVTVGHLIYQPYMAQEDTPGVPLPLSTHTRTVNHNETQIYHFSLCEACVVCSCMCVTYRVKAEEFA